MVMLRRELRSQTDYTPETDFRLFRNVSVQDPRHNLDHYMVLGCLHSAHLREHTDYLGWSMWIPIRPPATPMREDGLFATLLKAIPKPKAREARKNNYWELREGSSIRESLRYRTRRNTNPSYVALSARST